MPFLTWLFGGSALAKAVLLTIGALTAGAGYFALRAAWRRQGREAALDQLRKEGEDARNRMDEAAGAFERDGAAERLRRGTY